MNESNLLLCCRGHCARYNQYDYPDEEQRKELVAIHIRESKVLKENLK